MTRHPRIGLAVLGACLASLTVLAFLVVRGGVRVVPVAADQEAVVAPRATVPDAAPQAGAVAGEQDPFRGIDPAWLSRTSRAAGIPAAALRAYAAAQLRLAQEQPGCHLSWNTVAGLGWVESQHGTLGGRTLGADGLSSGPVIGPALDGRGFAAIRSTPASAAWHGDRTWEHAVGPLQFLASSWARWGADGDGDGREDPLDLDDAAVAAARYLCADGHDLATPTGWTAAVHSYNHDHSYVRAVLVAANTYAERSARG